MTGGPVGGVADGGGGGTTTVGTVEVTTTVAPDSDAPSE